MSVFDSRSAAIGQREGHCDGMQRHNRRSDQQRICSFYLPLSVHACLNSDFIVIKHSLSVAASAVW